MEIAPLPGNLLGVRVGATPQEIRVVTRTGTPLPTDPSAIVPTELPSILLSPVPRFRGLAFYSGPAGDEIVAGLSFYDLSGHLLRTVDEGALGVQSVLGVAPITSGQHKGRFAAIEPQTSELIIFTLP
ncbi:MAG TPA: hypothetical protein VFB99_17150 [Vicinamibacterales bacterium]|nr:hypothetical protein [Vicinamibacterales bacterium]